VTKYIETILQLDSILTDPLTNAMFFYFFPTAQKKLKFCRHTIGTFASRTSRHTNPSLQKSQLSHPPQDGNETLKLNFEYLNRLKNVLN
jgi:hypothetical protein